jgi:putative ABC transport system permease protein
MKPGGPLLLSRLITFRSLRSRFLRTLLSTFGIVLGVASILSIGITNQTAMRSIARLFESTSGKANLIVQSANSSQNNFSDLSLNRVSSLAGVKTTVPSLQITTLLADSAPADSISLNFFGASMNALTLYGIEPKKDLQTRDYKLISGQFLSDDLQAQEIVLVKDFCEDNDLKLGDRVSILTPGGIEKLRLVGMIAREGVGQVNNGAFGVIPLRTAQKLFEMHGKYTQIDLVLHSEYTSAEALDWMKTQLQGRLGDDYSVIYPASQGKRMAQMLSSYQIGLNFMSGMALFVGAFLIYNAFTMTVVERKREFGTLRIIGMTRRQVVAQVLTEANLLGFLGAALGVALGLLMAAGLTRLMSWIIGQELDNIVLDTSLLILSISVGMIVTVFAAVMPALQAGKISPLEALRVRGIDKEGWLIRHAGKVGAALLLISIVILIANPFPYDVQFRLGSMAVFSLFFGATLMIPDSLNLWEKLVRPFVRRVYGNAGYLGSRNLQRSRLRATLTVAALMVGVAMVLIVKSMTASFGSDLKTWINSYIGGDFYISSSLPMRQELARRLEAVPGVTSVAPIRYLETSWFLPDGSQEDISLMVIEPFSYQRVTSFVFSQKSQDPQASMQRLAQGNAVFISSVLAEKYNLVQGSRVELQTRRGRQSFEVAGIVVDFYNQGNVIEISWNDMRRYFKESDASTFLLKVEEGADAENVGALIDHLYGKRYKLTITSNQEIKSSISAMLAQSFSMFDVLAIISVIVASLGVVNTLTMNVMERTREIGMLRSIGMTRWQVVWMVMAEAGIMGIMGGILGVGLGVLLSRIFLLAMMAMSGYELDFMMPAQGIFTGLGIAVIASQLAAILPALRAARLRVLEAIHYE